MIFAVREIILKEEEIVSAVQGIVFGVSEMVSGGCGAAEPRRIVGRRDGKAELFRETSGRAAKRWRAEVEKQSFSANRAAEPRRVSGGADASVGIVLGAV